MMYGLGYSPRQYWDEMTPREVVQVLRGFRWKEEQTGWAYTLFIAKVIRWMGALIHNLWSKKGQRKDPEKLLQLPEDKKRKPITQKDWERLKHLAKRWKNVK